jgi:hypothetical protein
MKKSLGVSLVAILFAFVLAGWGFAQEKAKPSEMAKPGEAMKKEPEAKPTEMATKPEAKKEEMKKKAPPKIVQYRAGGIVLSADPATGKFSIQQDQVPRKRELKLQLGPKEAGTLQEIKPGEAVNVWVRGNTVTELVKVWPYKVLFSSRSSSK